VVAPSLSFSPTGLSYSFVKGNSKPASQSSTLSANIGTPPVSLVKSANSGWLTLPPAALGSLSFTIDTTGLTPGTYTSTVTASASGYPDATLQVTLTVLPIVTKSISFTQASQTADVEQGSSQSLLEYISTSDNTPANVQLTADDGSNTTPTWLSVGGKILNG